MDMLPANSLPWLPDFEVKLEQGLAQEIYPFIILTRLQFFRNFADMPFFISANPDKARAIQEKAFAFFNPIQILSLYEKDREMESIWASERHLRYESEYDFSGKNIFKSIAWLENGKKVLWINESEHLTWLQFLPGLLSLEQLQLELLANPLKNTLSSWSWEKHLGYLNSDPGKCGAGFAMSVLVHLPAIGLSRQLQAVDNALNAMNLDFVPWRSNSAQGSETFYFWIRSRGGLGKSEVEITENFMKKVKHIFNLEQQMQQHMFQKETSKLEDRVHKAFHLLTQGRNLPYAEFLSFQSMTRLGAYLKILPKTLLTSLEVLRINTQQAHFQVKENREIRREEEDFLRSNVVRLYLGGN